MSKIRIVNWLLTRKCNLNCDYCAIVKNYPGKPKEYPNMGHYIKNEMGIEVVIEGLQKIHKHNPNAFHIFYGGEPLLRKDLSIIVNFCNKNNIQYTIISNNTKEIQPLIRKLFDDTDYIQGFTSSVDPIFNEVSVTQDRVRKSIAGLKQLKDIQKEGNVKDVVAEITVMNHNLDFLYDLVSDLSYHGIYSDITFVDIAKTPYYDFSNITDESALVKPTFELAMLFEQMMKNEGLLIHMKNELLPMMFDTLPSNMDCELEKGVHNITIDADGTIRLCLRIRGTVPSYFKINDIFQDDDCQKLKPSFEKMIKWDKECLCKGCNHSCLLMSKYIDNTGDGEEDLIHSDKRG